MASFFNSVSAVAVVFLLMLTGYLMARRGMMRPEHKAFVSKLLINIGIPSLCFSKILTNFDRDMLSGALAMLLVPLLGMGLLMLFSAWLGKRLGLPRERLGPFTVMGGLSNSIFIGYPMCLELFGEACTPYVMWYYLTNTLMFQTIGVGMISRSGEGDGRLFTRAGLRKVATNPPFIAIAACVAMLLLDIRLPHAAASFTQYLGNIVSPLGLIYTGYVMYETGFKAAFRPDRGHGAALLIRFVIAPALCMLLCGIFGVTGLARSVNIIEMAMPVMTQVVVMSGSFGADEKYAAKGAVLSTLGSFLVIPILMMIV